MLDLLTIEEDKVAAAQGWGVYHIYDMAVDQWAVRVLPVTAQPNIIILAKQGNSLAVKALRLVMHGPQKENK